jgi:hypothetical protein
LDRAALKQILKVFLHVEILSTTLIDKRLLPLVQDVLRRWMLKDSYLGTKVFNLS